MRLPTLKYRKVVKVLTKIGFVRARQTGSHLILVKKDVKKIVTVPIHANRDIKRGTLRAIIKQAGLTVKEFLDFLK